MKAFLLSFLFITSTFFTLTGTDYYVDPSKGNDDTNNGSSGSPWQTLNKACESVRTPGDVIVLSAGTFSVSEQCDLAVGVSIRGQGRNTIIESNVTEDYVPTILLESSSLTNGNQSISNLKMDGKLAAWGAVRITLRSNVEIHDCYFIDFFNTAVIFNSEYASMKIPPTVFCTGNKFYNNTIINCSHHPYGSDDAQGGLCMGGQEGMKVYHNYMTQVDREDGYNGFVVKFHTNGHMKDFEFYNNTVIKAPYLVNTWWDFDFAIEFWHSLGGINIHDNYIEGGFDIGGAGGRACIKGEYDYAFWIHDNIFWQDSLPYVAQNGIYIEASTEYVLIERNRFHNLTNPIILSPDQWMYGVGLSDTARYHTIRYNLFTEVGSDKTFQGYGLRYYVGEDDADCHDIKIYNNTFNAAEDAPYPLAAIGIPAVGNTFNINIYNNIIHGFSHAPMYTSGAQGQVIDNIAIQNNLFYENGHNNEVWFDNLTPTNYTNTGNTVGDPGFHSLENYRVNSGSPALNAGLVHSSDHYDMDGVLIPAGTTPTLGAYQTQADLAGPVLLNSVVEDYDPTLIIATFDLSINEITPDKSAFSVEINSKAVSVESVSIVNGLVHIKTGTFALYGDIVSLSYTPPAQNPLQSVSSVPVEAFRDVLVINKVSRNTTPEEKSKNFNLYPNPMQDSFTIEILGDDLPEDGSILKLYTLEGNLVFESVMETVETTNTFFVKLEPGLFIVQIVSKSSVVFASKLLVIST